MKLLELLPKLPYFVRIRRESWSKHYLVRSEYMTKGLIKIDLDSMQIGEYMLSIDDLLASDWEIVE